MEQSKINRGDLENIHVLVAEDDPINMIIAEKILKAKNATVTKAVNGFEAVELLNNGLQPDLVLLDLEMPRMDGYKAVEKIKEKLPAIPVLAFTAFIFDKRTEAELIQKGFTDSISKPFHPEIFYAKIFKALGIC
jgi:CheY-like chemotaxis protein